MQILVFGKNGQVATELGAYSNVTCIGRDVADLGAPATCARAIEHHKPDAVINAAAYTAVDQAETDEALATVVNGDAPTAMAKACGALNIPIVHISTDYVFDGSGTSPWETSDQTSPVGAYGRSKLAGEKGVLSGTTNAAVLRTSWVFSRHGSNFLKTMLRLSETRDALNVVSDQIGGPTEASHIAAACIQMAQTLAGSPETSGLYHFSGAPDASWADFAREIFRAADREVIVTGIPSSAYPTPATRPLNSRLDCSDIERVFGVKRPDWRQDVHRVVDALT